MTCPIACEARSSEGALAALVSELVCFQLDHVAHAFLRTETCMASPSCTPCSLQAVRPFVYAASLLYLFSLRAGEGRCREAQAQEGGGLITKSNDESFF